MKWQWGVMQGRLLPKINGRFQAHPAGQWQDEFPLAKQIGFDLLEFILDDPSNNPLLSESGITSILRIIGQTGVQVKTICADFFMARPIHARDAALVRDSMAVAEVLIANARLLSVTDVVLPCVDESSLLPPQSRHRFCENIAPLLAIAANNNVRICLEADLPPREYAELLQRVDSPNLSVNYDSGNSASLKYDAESEFKAYGTHITDIHIKDRTAGGGSVLLGTGAVDFAQLMNCMTSTGYNGPLIMQAWRDEEGLAITRQQLLWIQRLWEHDE